VRRSRTRRADPLGVSRINAATMTNPMAMATGQVT